MDKSRVDMDWDGDTPTATFHGDIDYAVVDHIDPAEVSKLAAGRELRVDMTGVTFIDSTGIGLLIKLQRAAGSLRIIGASRETRRLFTITGLDSVFTYGD